MFSVTDATELVQVNFWAVAVWLTQGCQTHFVSGAKSQPLKPKTGSISKIMAGIKTCK